MDHPSYRHNHQCQRYPLHAPPPSTLPPPPPRPHPFPENPKLYHPPQHPEPPLPRPPLPPLPHLFRPPIRHAPPRPLEPHRLIFASNLPSFPAEDNRRRLVPDFHRSQFNGDRGIPQRLPELNFPRHDSRDPSRVPPSNPQHLSELNFSCNDSRDPSRVLSDNPPRLSEFHLPRNDCRDPSRVPLENRISQIPTLRRFDYDHEDHRDRFDHRPMSPYLPGDKFRQHNSEGGFRLRDEFGHERNSGEEIGQRSHAALDSEAPRWNPELASNHDSSSRDFDLNFGSYDQDLVRGARGNVLGGRQRWGYSRLTERDFHDSEIEMEKNVIDGADRARVHSGKHGYVSWDLGRYNNDKGSRENNDENNRAPRKNFQKSAFSRIQVLKPIHRSREHERLHYPGYCDSSNSRAINRGKDHQEEKRPGSPMELDVSFKSNALIAKAISAPLTDTSSSSRHREIRKAKESGKDCSISLVNNLNEGTAKLDIFAQVASNASSCVKDFKHSDEKTTAFGILNMQENGSQQCSSGTKVSTLKSKVEKPLKDVASQKTGGNIGSGMTSTSTRKKKVVKKVISRRGSSALRTKKQGVSLLPDSSTSRLEEPSGSEKGVNTMVEETHSPVRASMVDLEEHLVNVDCGMKRVHNDKIMRNSSDLSLSPLNEKETNILLGSVNAASGQGSDTASNIDDINKSKCEITTPYPERNENGTKQFSQDRDSLAFGNMENESQEGALSVDIENSSDLMVKKTINEIESQKGALPGKGDSSSYLLSSENINIPYCSVNGQKATELVSETGLVNSPEKNTSADANTVNNIIVHPCIDYVTTLQNNSEVEGGLKSRTDSGNNKAGVLLSSEETSSPSECCNHRSGTISDFRDSSTNLEEISIPVCESSVDIYQQRSAGSVTISPDTAFTCANATISMECSDDDTTISKKRKAETDIDISRTNEMYMRPLGVNDRSQEENPSSSEVPVSGLEKLNFEVQPSAERFCFLHWNASAAGVSGDKVSAKSSAAGTNGNSPPYGKRSKMSGSSLGLSNAYASEDGDKLSVEETSMSVVKAPPKYDDALTKPEGHVAVTSTDAVNTASRLPCSGDAKMLSEDALVREPSKAADGVEDVFADDGLEFNCMSIDSRSLSGNLAVTNTESLGIHDSPVIPQSDQNDKQDMGSSGVENFGLHGSDERIIIHSRSAQCRVCPEVPNSDLCEKPSTADIESDGYHTKKDLPSLLKDSSSSTDSVAACTLNFVDELQTVPEKLLHMGSPQTLSNVPDIQLLEGIQPKSLSQLCDSAQGDDREPDENHFINGKLKPFEHASPIFTHSNMKSDDAGENVHLANQTVVSLLSQSLDSTIIEQFRLKNQQIHPFSRTLAGNPSFKTVSLTHVGKARTWNRNDNKSVPSLPRSKSFVGIVPHQRKFQPDTGKVQGTSYIRKGNSLVRNSASTATSPQRSSGLTSVVYSLNSSVSDEMKNSTTAEVSNPLDTAKTGGENGPSERPRTPPKSNGIQKPGLPVVASIDTTFPVLVVPSLNGCESTSDSVISNETTDNVLNTSEGPDNQICPISYLESQSEPNDGDARYSSRRIIYVKRKSNQLVAASTSGEMSAQSFDRSQASSSESYYKRSKNQLIRTSLESQTKQSSIIPDDNVSSEKQRVTKVASDGSHSKKNLEKAITKRHKLSKFSLVWTPYGARSARSDGALLPHPKVLPHLFPWKRVTNWRSLMQNSTSVSNSRSLSAIRKLLLLRKRNTVYTRSAHGYSIRKSKVLSIGGSNLKWSKSMEKRSKRVNEEATLAVAAVEKKKREKKDVASATLSPENRNHSSRERIFRIGPFRYKMDPSRRTLQRIPEDESSGSSAATVVKDAKRSYVPKRLVIGSDEYVRIGNGNQLIRDPKKRTRVLASEKIRWSLHTARLRLAKKRKYCQFYTRFGKCNKDDGKCPYIHDPSKIAVCTKFLNGLCSNSSCKLTHKVIPERMPDCSYFLQGLCNNKDCPYRHVNVNPNASVCEGFLRGYCAVGNECQKKHSYVCPTFEATGSCPLGSKCKLHHPKSRSKGKKRKRSGEQGSSRGRYFGAMHIGVSKCGTTVSEKGNDEKDSGNVEAIMPEYISLEVRDEEIGESDYRTSNQTRDLESETTYLLADDLDAAIKPVRIMNKDLTK